MNRSKVVRVGRILSALFIATAVMYAVLGGVLIFQARAQQTQSSIYPAPTRGPQQNVPVPTGSDDASVKAFFDYNALRHVSTLRETYIVDPYYWGTMYLTIGLLLLVLYFLTFAWYARVRRRADLYPVEVYNAVITERGGPVDTFNWVVYAVLLSYMVYYTVTNLAFGQYY